MLQVTQFQSGKFGFHDADVLCKKSDLPENDGRFVFCGSQGRQPTHDYNDEETILQLSFFSDTEVEAIEAVSIWAPREKSARDYYAAEAIMEAQDEQEEQIRHERASQRHADRISRDAENIKNLKNFTGGKRIVFNFSFDPLCGGEYDLEREWWIGKTGTCTSTEDVSPNALRDRTGSPSYYIGDDSEPIPGNSNRNITRFFGWRGTNDDRCCTAHGVRMIEKIVKFHNHYRIYISKYDKNYTD